ncbi:TPA: GxxExxY protein [bacterium]|nr:GxxExxY protein [bacterium]
MKYEPLSEIEQKISQNIVDSAYTVHKNLGAGLLENVYEVCFCHEIAKRGFSYQRQVSVPIIYDGIKFDEAFRIDVLVENTVICELKSVEQIKSVHNAQVLTQLRLTGKRLGFLINFNVPLIKDGIRRLII